MRGLRNEVGVEVGVGAVDRPATGLALASAVGRDRLAVAEEEEPPEFAGEPAATAAPVLVGDGAGDGVAEGAGTGGRGGAGSCASAAAGLGVDAGVGATAIGAEGITGA